MTDILKYIGSWSVLQWIALVLIAGFIGQFGKMAANAIAKNIRQRREGKSQLPKEGGLPSETTTGVVPYSIKPESSAKSPDATGKSDKKLIKALAKANKKESKKKY